MAETPDIELASTSPLNRVPVEIWVSILSHLADLHHLWTACRSVSRGFRGFVEQLFAQHHIQHTFVELDLGELNNKRTWAISVTGYGYVPGKAGAPRDLVDRLIPLSFDHFSPDRKLACFKDYRPQECFVSEDTWVDAVNLWKSELPAQVRASDLPPHIVQVRSYLCDYHLPDIMTDAENRLVSFDWRALFTSFFREIGMLKRWVSRDLLPINAMAPDIPVLNTAFRTTWIPRSQNYQVATSSQPIPFTRSILRGCVSNARFLPSDSQQSLHQSISTSLQLSMPDWDRTLVTWPAGDERRSLTIARLPSPSRRHPHLIPKASQILTLSQRCTLT